MPIRVRLYKNGKEIFSRGAPCRDRCSPASNPLEKGDYTLEIIGVGTQAQTVKPFVDYIKKKFSEDPESILRIEDLLLEFLQKDIALDRPKDVINRVLNRIKNITGGVTALILEPFVVIRTSAAPTGFKKPYITNPELEGILAIPLEEFVRYRARFKSDGIDSRLLYLSVSDAPSGEFFRRLHERISSLKGFEDDILEIVYKKNNKRVRLVGLFERAKELLKQSIKSLPEVENVNIDLPEERPFVIVNGRIRPVMRLKIKLTQMPPALDTKQVAEASRRAVYEKAREIFYRVLLANIPGFSIEDVDRFVDLEGIDVIVNMRTF